MMNDQAHQRALERYEQLKSELEELEHYFKVRERFSGSKSPDIVAVQGQVIATVECKTTPVADVLDLARSILRAHKRPMPLGELYDAVRAKGIVIGGKNPRNNFCAKLAGAPDLKTVRGEGWQFKREKGSANGLSAEPFRNGAEASG